MAEPISDSELAKVRSISQGGTRGEMHASVPIDVLASILARLDAAEAKLANLARIVDPKSYFGRAGVVPAGTIKEIVDG